MLESAVKHQKNEKRRTAGQNKRASNVNVMNTSSTAATPTANNKSDESRCTIM